MIRKLLVANRGEIACRIMRTSRRMGMVTVAVYSDADRDAMHVRMADMALPIGPAPARDSYLNIDAVLEAVRESGADAVHPGYGFLSENADFAEALQNAGIIFVGPPSAAMRLMGSKSEAKRSMQAVGVAVAPGYHGAAQDTETLQAEAAHIGYPVLIKATMGGGGRGLRVVREPDSFAEALDTCRREALAGFGDDSVLIERYLPDPRHIEVQIFRDAAGNTTHLFERDCSLQRHHQKVIEEAPAPGLDADVRRRLADMAVRAAEAADYQGAGTVEFLVSGDDCCFMEMNTRLQVEHPVTEMITGQDLVEWQLRIAAGEGLPLSGDAMQPQGHAIEARLCAEEPERGFRPAVGRLSHVRFPRGGGIRVDAGIVAGDVIGVAYDSMIAKIIAHGPDRATALARLERALRQTEIAGLACNRDFLLRALAHEDFGVGRVDTGFIARHEAALTTAPPPSVAAQIIAALALLTDQAEGMGRAHPQPDADGDVHSPWNRVDGWRLYEPDQAEITFLAADGARIVIPYTHTDSGMCRFEIDGTAHEAGVRSRRGPRFELVMDSRVLKATCVIDGAQVTVFHDGVCHRLTSLQDSAEGAGDGPDTAAGQGRLTAPMPGRIVKIQVTSGEMVAQGAVLLVLEAMKMEHAITAPRDGQVAALHCAVGEQVEEGAVLIEFAVPESADGSEGDKDA